jgi:cyclase
VLKKRLIGVVTVRRGWAVQSFGYGRWLPLGRPEILVENLDRWGVDEILLQCIDRSAAGAGPDLPLLDRVARRGLATPLIYGGGIAGVDDANAVVQRGADRVVVDALLHRAPDQVAAISQHLGAQAVVAALPLALAADGSLRWLDHVNRREKAWLGADAAAAQALLADGLVSEALAIDWRHEGQPGGFDERLLDALALPGVPLLAFGGLSEPAQHRRVLERPQVVATAVGNFFAWREHAVQQLKAALAGLPLRAPEFAPGPTL